MKILSKRISSILVELISETPLVKSAYSFEQPELGDYNRGGAGAQGSYGVRTIAINEVK
ncbi:MAG TPA: hypothetical protein VJT08_10615 [Terriglobales bacterium]|nr:hypothetical protein [Terriglobales bacterium]